MFLLAMSIGLSGCDNIETPIEPTPDPKPEEVKSEITIDADIVTNGLSFTSDKGEKSVTFTTNEDWALSIVATQGDDRWCTASATNGEKGSANVTFTVTENTSYDDRCVSVTIKSGSASKTFNIIQKYAGALLLTANKYELDQLGGTIEIEVKANIDYEMEIDENAKEWISETPTRAMTTHKHNLVIASNTNAAKREGKIYFKSGDKIDTVIVYQLGNAFISISPKEYTVSAKGETIEIHVWSNVEYEVQMPDVDWIIANSTLNDSFEYNSYEYIIAPNEEYENRSAEIIFYDKSNELKETFTVVQTQKDVVILPQNNFTVDYEGGIVEIQISSNTSYGVQISDSWIDLIETRTLTENSICLAITANSGIFERSATIYLTPSTTDWVPITITQHGCSDMEVAVTLEDAGTLKQVLGDNYKEITILKITGPINGDDIYDLRKMLGNTHISETNWGKLKKLDLSEASIVEGGGCYYVDYPEYYTSNNIIGESMFSDCDNLQEIILPKNITTISRCAFSHCNHLEKVSMFEGVRSIGEYAFNGCNLTSIQIPSTLTNIGTSAFNGDITGSKTSVYITDLEAWFNINFYWWTSNPLSSSSEYSGGKLYLNGEEVTELIVPEGVTKINSFAFYGCKSIKKIVIREGVSSIGAGAFFGCTSLTEIYSYATTPPEIIKRLNYSTEAFDYDIRHNATLYVPERCASKYGFWGFDNIVEME